ncbi:MAG: hypothetical protein N2515_11630, partial [Deltaproteobacteria bacterium]|nr:hypothetical protein [Deltaproteobacteria bacterium]
LTLKSNTPLKVHLRTQHADYEDVIEPSKNAEYALHIPIGSRRLGKTFLALAMHALTSLELSSGVQ